MTAVKRDYVLPEGVVRKGYYRDGPLFDPGVDCGFDPETGEELVSLAKQSFRDECDINTIMRRYETTGTIDHVNRRQPQFGDFSDVASYQEAINIVAEAEANFADLPSRIRDRFGNDPARLLEFLQDPRNFDEAVELGIVEKPTPPPPPPAAEASAPASPATPPPPQPKAP